MRSAKTVNIFDASLTPNNAAYKGYEYIDDIILDFKSNYQSTSDFLEIIKKNKFRLGIPIRNGSEYVGLYIPIIEIEKTI
jgi:hypothetical protein